MSETFALKSEPRNELGTKNAVAAREAGKLPVVIYGHKQDTVSILLNEHDFVEALHHGHRVFEIDVEGKNEQLLLKDLQYDHLGKKVIHADLVRVDLTETVQVSVGLEFKGTAKGTLEGGVVDEIMTEIEIECVVTNIPDRLPVSVKNMEIGDSMQASEIDLPQGVTLITEPDAVIASCHYVTIEEPEEETEELEEPEGPEVITEKKEEGEEAGSEAKE